MAAQGHVLGAVEQLDQQVAEPAVSLRFLDGNTTERPLWSVKVDHILRGVLWRCARSVQGQTHFGMLLVSDNQGACALSLACSARLTNSTVQR